MYEEIPKQAISRIGGTIYILDTRGYSIDIVKTALCVRDFMGMLDTPEGQVEELVETTSLWRLQISYLLADKIAKKYGSAVEKQNEIEKNIAQLTQRMVAEESSTNVPIIASSDSWEIERFSI